MKVGIGMVAYIIDHYCFDFQHSSVRMCVGFYTFGQYLDFFFIYFSVNIFKVQWNIWSVHSWLVSTTCIIRYVPLIYYFKTFYYIFQIHVCITFYLSTIICWKWNIYILYSTSDKGQKQILPITHYIQNQLFLIILHISNLTVI